MLRSAISAFTRVFDALWLAAWCAADPGSILTTNGSRFCGAPRRGAAPRPGHERSSRRGEIHGGFRERGQAFVGFLLLLQGLIQQPHGVLHSELLRPLLQRAVARDFVMLDGLGRGQHAGIERLAALVLVHDLLALVEDALDGVTGLAARRLVDQFENLLEAFDLAFGLAEMLFERRAQ